MENNKVKLFPHLTEEVVADIRGFKLDAYLIALEGFRRGLTLKWYKDETEKCKLHRLNSSTDGKFFSLSSDKQSHYFFRSRGDLVANKTVNICTDKEKTKQLLKDGGVPIPEGELFDITESKKMVKYAEKIGYPVIIKPLNGSMGRGVYINLQNRDELLNAIKETQTTYKQYKTYLVEKHYFGKEYRVYVVGDKAVVATHRIPANITGDGKNTVEKLIKLKNIERKKNPYLAPKAIKIDYEVKNYLKNYGYNEKSVPKKGELLILRGKSNLSAGGDPIEKTYELTNEVKQIAVDALKAMPSIPHAGVDVIVDPDSNKKAVVLEINATAEIAFHCFPLEGEAKDVPGAIIDYYFPETKGKEKSNFYFDFNSLLQPLKTWAADEVKVTMPPIGDIYSKKYIASGKVHKVGYMSWIKRHALKNNLSGYVKKREGDRIEVVIFGTQEQKEIMQQFAELCRKGSKKSRVDNLEEERFELHTDQPLKLGFELILE
ncbi:acylphosphatase [Oceanobacillus sp. FSL K6-2867]|uniref:acylphosphatase n=1 Tax=Oceanobacillus sp. FSL K6-2867 TaxID=2954748 RepID=UPI0030DBD148